MRALVVCRGLPQATRRRSALLALCLVMAAPRPAAAADGCQLFADPLATPPAVTVHNVIGTYRRLPVEDGWHTGSLAPAPGPGEGLLWTHAAGRSWTLAPDLANQRLITGPDNPNRRWRGADVQNFTLAFRGSTLVGFRLDNELHERDGALTARYDVAKGLLRIDRMGMGGRRYCRVEATLGEVLSVGSAPPQGMEVGYVPIAIGQQ